MKLWQNDDCAAWNKAFDGYRALILAHEVNQLPEIDAWYCNELPELVNKRKKPYLTKHEFLEVLRWKMKRGDWREGNRLRVFATDEAVIKRVTQDAFAAAQPLTADIATASKEYKEPVKVLCELDGVGPATASAALAVVRPDLYPFFDEWIGKQIAGLGKVAFTPSYYWKYADALRSKAGELTDLCGETWTAHDVGQALWVASEGKVKVK